MGFTFSAEHEQVRETVRRWADLGLLGVRYPVEDGGSGFDKVAGCIVREELSRASQAFASAWSAHTHLALWPVWRIGRFHRDALVYVIGEGTSEIQRNIIVRSLEL